MCVKKCIICLTDSESLKLTFLGALGFVGGVGFRSRLPEDSASDTHTQNDLSSAVTRERDARQGSDQQKFMRECFRFQKPTCGQCRSQSPPWASTVYRDPSADTSQTRNTCVLDAAQSGTSKPHCPVVVPFAHCCSTVRSWSCQSSHPVDDENRCGA